MTGSETGFFKGKVALVTGSSRGIGRAIAVAFGRAGSDVVINHSRSGGSAQNKADEVCREIEGLGQKSFSVQADIGLKSSVKEMMQMISAKFGRLDFLILNAAKAPFKPIEKLLERDIRQLVETNFMGMDLFPYGAKSRHGGRFPGAGRADENVKDTAGGGDLLDGECLVDTQLVVAPGQVCLCHLGHDRDAHPGRSKLSRGFEEARLYTKERLGGVDDAALGMKP